MFEYFKILISQTPKVLLGIALFCIIAISLPDRLLYEIGFFPYTGSIRQWLYIILLLSLSLLFSHFLFWLSSVVKGKFNYCIFIHRGKKRLKNLTKAEKEILRAYIQKDTMSQTFDCTDGVVLALEYASIIYQASTLSKAFTNFSYNIQPWALKYLKKNPALLL